MPTCNNVLQNQTELVCNGHGSCDAPNVCRCHSDWTGPLCEYPYCFGIPSNTSATVCSGHGNCTNVDTCVCNGNWVGSNCSMPTCFGIYQNSTSVCSGHGTCNDIDVCSCDSNWGGQNCSLPKCFGILQNMTGSVCNGHGSCNDVDTCECTSNWGGPSCALPKCYGILQNLTISVCSGHGSCNDVDTCACFSNWGGQNCSIPKCFGILQNMTGVVCSGHGSCNDVDTCVCDPNWGGQNCSVPKCFGILQNMTSEVCSGHGSCNDVNTCQCYSNWGGPTCALPMCFGILQNMTSEVCSGHGSCNDVDMCTCLAGWAGSNCSMPTCNNILQNQTELVCNGHGSCDAPNVCRCHLGWTDTFCSMPICYGLLSNMTGSVCSGHGSCNSVDRCDCHTNYFGNMCELTTCSGIASNSSGVCSGRGQCSSFNNCTCIPGFLGTNCESYGCFGFEFNSTNACSGKGVCILPNMCSCNVGFSNFDCSVIECFGKFSNSSNVCSGNGTCTDYNNCTCLDGFTSYDCSVNINPYMISLSSSAMQIVTSSNITSVEVEINIPTDVNLLNTTFHWYCLNCQGVSNASVFMIGSNQQKLTISINELKAPGSYLFHANTTTMNPDPFPSRISNTVVFNLTLLVPYAPDLSVPSLGVFGLPSAFVSTRSGQSSGQSISAVISNIVMNQTNIEKFLGCKANCTSSLTYSWQLTSTSSNALEASSTGSVSAFTSGNNLMILQPPITVSATLRTLVSNSKIGFSLALFNSQMQNISSRVDIPVLSPMSPPSSTNVTLPTNTTNSVVASSFMQVVPAQGVALTDTFTINITAWNAPSELLPLRYAVGFYDKSKGKDVRFTEFSQNLTITVYLPFIQNKARRRNVQAVSQVELVVYVMDALGNEASQSSNVSVSVSPFNGTSTQLLERINELSGTSLIIASFDQSYTALSSSGTNSSAVIYELVKNIEIDPKNPSVALSSFESLTSSSSSIDANIVNAVTSKLSSFVDGVKNTYSDEKKLYGFVKSKLADQDVTSTISVSSNLLASGVSSDKTRNVTENISSMVLLGEVAKVIDQSSGNTLPTVSYSTSLINITISSFKLNSDISSNQTLTSGSNSVEMSISQIMKQYNAFAKECGVSMIEYAKNTNFDNYTSNNVITSIVNDFKFIQEQTPLILNNLNQPIILSFKLDSSILIGKNISNSTFSCRYWDEEEKRWSNEGCWLHRVEIATGTIDCACSHTTMFTTFLEQKTTVNILEVKDQVASLYFAQIAFGCIYTLVPSSC
ncbi:hypothetical protein C9374_004465 [Naegleria lovaniensis]|uniref:Uncharacterized protein n=1 Tax=Naegleria lovaniensis TaxID=51637 RepID=A0AA88GS30_NAELO|nr:uncharacterized protein C9374_004465 [Naegleria lovaniensis]KAG2383128.1 hypothetical protein C9374_004465 [Naegleria lovaniensis]